MRSIGERPVHDTKERVNTFFNFDQDSFQQRVELFKNFPVVRKTVRPGRS